MYLLDTDVLSFSSPSSSMADKAGWTGWVRANSGAIFLSAITIMEIRFGVERLSQRGASAKATALRRWLLAIETIHAGRIIPIDAAIAHRAGELLAIATHRGARPSSEDALIAATADLRGMKLVSRNSRHMGPLGIVALDPFKDSAE